MTAGWTAEIVGVDWEEGGLDSETGLGHYAGMERVDHGGNVDSSGYGGKRSEV